jgi:5'-3' exonuclease
MGIRGNFKRCVADLFPGCLSLVSLGHFRGKRVAIDFSNLYVKYKMIFKDDWRRHLDRYAENLVANGLAIIFVMDGKMPASKLPEQTRRRERIQKDDERVKQLKELRARYDSSPNKEDAKATTRLLSIYARQVNSDIYKLLVDRISSGAESLGAAEVVEQLDDIIAHLEEAQMPRYDRDEVDFFRASSRHACLLAEGEAEQTMALMCQNGIVDYAMSDDSDLIALQCPRIIRKVPGGSVQYELFELEKLCALSKMCPREITDWCVLCGTDYNRSPAGVGAKTAYKLMRQIGSMDGVLMSKPDVWGMLLGECLNARKLFVDNEGLSLDKIRQHCEMVLPSNNQL